MTQTQIEKKQSRKNNKKQKTLIQYPYRRCLSTDGRTEYIFLTVGGRSVRVLSPLWTKRSRTGAHGTDYYTSKYLERADAMVTVDVSNSGKHYCKLVLLKPLTPMQLLRLAKWLNENEHICRRIAEDLVKYGLPPEVLRDLY